MQTQLHCATRVHQQASNSCSPQTTDQSLEARAERLRAERVRAVGSVQLDTWQLSMVCIGMYVGKHGGYSMHRFFFEDKCSRTMCGPI